MPNRITEAAKIAFDKYFAERQIYVRSGGEVRYLTLSQRFQCGAAICATLFVFWCAFATVSTYVSDSQVESKNMALVEIREAYEKRLEKQKSKYDELEQDLFESEKRFDVVLEQLNGKQGRLIDAASVESTLEVRLAAIKKRLETVTEERNEAVYKFTNMRMNAAQVEDALEGARKREEQMKETLQSVSTALTTAAADRDSARSSAETLQAEYDQIKDEITRVTEQRDQIMSRLEDAAKVSLSELHNIIKKTGVDVNSIIKSVERSYSGAGGPFIPLGSIQAVPAEFTADYKRVDSLLSTMDRVNLHRIAIDKLPLAKPVRTYRYTSGFGARKDPKSGRRAYHKGMDMAAPRGTPVYAPADGVVIKAGRERGYGNVIRVKHALGFVTVYAHLHRIHVKSGQRIERGQKIGQVGSTGKSTGSHLHYEIRYNKTAINPVKFIEAGKHVF